MFAPSSLLIGPESLPAPAIEPAGPAAEIRGAEIRGAEVVTGAAAGWLHGEPALIDILTDPTADALMERDDVDQDDLVLFLQDVRAALAARRVGLWLAGASKQALPGDHGDFALHAWHVPGLRRD